MCVYMCVCVHRNRREKNKRRKKRLASDILPLPISPVARLTSMEWTSSHSILKFHTSCDIRLVLLADLSVMFPSEDKTHSIRNALFDAAVQLSVPTVISTASAASKARASSTTEETIRDSRSRSPSVKSRYSLASVLTPHPSRQAKILRDVATQSSPVPATDEKTQQRPNHLNLILDRNNNPTPIAETSREYLSVPRYSSSSTSPSTSPTRHSKSLRSALLGLWQGLNSDELRSAASSPIDPKFFEDRVRLVRLDVHRFFSSSML